jgi:aconitase A
MVLVPLTTDARTVLIAPIDSLGVGIDVGRLPYTLRILLENVVRGVALGTGDVVHQVNLEYRAPQTQWWQPGSVRFRQTPTSSPRTARRTRSHGLHRRPDGKAGIACP